MTPIEQKAISFLAKVVPQPINELGLIIGDNIKYWRWKNQVSIMEKAENLIKAKGINIKKVSPKQILPLLDYSSNEDNPDMQELWANLLANTVSDKHNFENTVLIRLLSEMTPTDAQILSFILTGDKFEIETTFHEDPESVPISRVKEQFSPLDIEANMANLFRLRVLERTSYGTSGQLHRFSLTALGFELFTRCFKV